MLFDGIRVSQYTFSNEMRFEEALQYSQTIYEEEKDGLRGKREKGRGVKQTYTEDILFKWSLCSPSWLPSLLFSLPERTRTMLGERETDTNTWKKEQEGVVRR